jgi:outer membrane protein OmpA-like peptidoglycan-associated protein
MKHMSTTWVTRLAVAALAVVVAGCGLNKMQQGAIIGAGAGGAAGAVVGHATGSTVRGAIIGAAVGGVAGGVIGHQMDQQAEELAYAIPGATVSRVGEGIAVTFPDGTLFPSGSDQLMPVARDNMRKFAASLAKYPETRTMIVGHTDSIGSAAYNADLSQRRAQATASFLAGEGIDRSRLGTSGRGETEPISSNDTEAGRQLNRRVEVAIYAAHPAGS